MSEEKILQMLKEALEEKSKLEAKVEELSRRLSRLEENETMDKEEKEAMLLSAQEAIKKAKLKEREEILHEPLLDKLAEALIEYNKRLKG